MLVARPISGKSLDCLAAHTAAARELLAKGGERPQARLPCPGTFARGQYACAESNDASLTGLGLELRVEIEQFREQIQNIE